MLLSGSIVIVFANALVAPLEAIGLFGFAWTSLGPQSNVHWIAPMIFSVLVGIANVSAISILRVENELT